MKKLLLLLSFVSLLFSSCSSDSSTSGNNQAFVLPSQDIYTNSLGQVYSTNYYYTGNKINYSESDNLKIVYLYTNDLITKKEFRDPNTNYLFSQLLFTYDNSQRIIKEITLSPQTDSGVKVLYEYNSDGTVTENVYLGTVAAQTTFESTGKYFVGTNGEIARKENYSASGTTTYYYSYDTKNNPFKNVLNLNKLRPMGLGSFNMTVSNAVNPSNVIINSTSHTISYNADNYPVSVITTSVNNSSGNSSTTSIQYFY